MLPERGCVRTDEMYDRAQHLHTHVRKLLPLRQYCQCMHGRHRGPRGGEEGGSWQYQWKGTQYWQSGGRGDQTARTAHPPAFITWRDARTSRTSIRTPIVDKPPQTDAGRADRHALIRRHSRADGSGAGHPVDRGQRARRTHSPGPKDRRYAFWREIMKFRALGPTGVAFEVAWTDNPIAVSLLICAHLSLLFARIQ